MRYKYLLLLLALLALNTPISAEYFRHIGLSEGLTQPSVMSIHQDQLGRMWFGTREGINLYDGKQITAFKGWCNASNDSAPIWLGNEVSSIVEDKQGNIFFLVDDDIIKFYNPQNHPSTFLKRSVSILRFFSKTKRLF